MRICVDLTPLEMMDRHGGIGRYTVALLEELLAIPAAERAGIDFYASLSSSEKPLPAEVALERAQRLDPVISPARHEWQRRFCSVRCSGSGASTCSTRPCPPSPRSCRAVRSCRPRTTSCRWSTPGGATVPSAASGRGRVST